jgi:hypothetical protein
VQGFLRKVFISGIACWIYGHTHTASEQHIHGVPLLCNHPKENKTWANKWIDLSDN